MQKEDYRREQVVLRTDKAGERRREERRKERRGEVKREEEGEGEKEVETQFFLQRDKQIQIKWG